MTMNGIIKNLVIINIIVLITRARVEYGRIFHEKYFHEPKARVNIRVKCPVILHDDRCNKLFILT